MKSISYYCLNDDKKCLELDIFKSIHNDSFKNTYNLHHKEKLVTYLYIKSESTIPFSQNEWVSAELIKEGDNALPIVMINNEIIKKGRLLTLNELSVLLDIGISVQLEEENT